MTDTPMTPDREQEIRTLDLLELMSDRAAPVISGHLAVLLAEVDRLRAALTAARTERIRHSGPDTKFCVLCLSGEHQRADNAPTTEVKR
ncbi:MAG: hypothetical protein ACRDQ0_00990 [Pseudonocardia sp.]